MRKNKFTASVPMSSMADIAFLLLVFFMVTSVLKTDTDIDLQLPDASGAELKDKEVMVSIDKNMIFWFGPVPMDRAAAINNIRAEVAEDSQVRVNIQAHSKLDFNVVQALLDDMREAGVKNFAMVTKQENRRL